MALKKRLVVKKTAKPVTAETPVSLGGPDWKSVHEIRNQPKHFSIPGPRIMRYPNTHGVRRDVKVQLNTWRGFSMGATHFYARVEVEPNAVWDPKELAWSTNDKATECKDIFYRAHVPTRAEGVLFIKMILETFYADQAQYRWCNGDHYGADEDTGTTWDQISAKLGAN
jgi:hypothetical protein